MTNEDFVPDSGDIVWVDFTPRSGHEQKGRRPAVVLSPLAYNRLSGLMVCVPVTSHVRGYPFEVALSGGKVTGVALADQVKSLDWRTRRVEYKDSATAAELGQIKSKIKALLEYP